MSDRVLYLVSSSASKEYVADCLEVFGLPRGLVHHFRYHKRYVDDALWAALAKTPGQLAAALRDITVVVIYLFQEQSSGAWLPRTYVPIRCGRLIEAFQDGNVGHFYFEVTDYVMQANNGTAARVITDEITFRTSDGANARGSYAHLDRDLGLAAPRTYGDTLAFQDFVDYASKATQWRTRSLGLAPLDVTYDVIFYRIAGVFREDGGALVEVSPTPVQLSGYPISEFRLGSEETYYIKVVTYLFVRVPALLPGQGTARLTLDFDPTILRPAGSTSLSIASTYDLEHLVVQPFGVTEQRRTVVSVRCRHETPTDRDNFVRREVLCAEIPLPLALQPSERGRS